ncbi:hypothetical protein IT403_01415 [Candidatus Nomurabacteria bacterium]|jgi:adenosine deaminase|nr:hypothetical protein [Candidatus Nomurabacteria bacterium]
MEQFQQNNTEKKEEGVKEEFSYTESVMFQTINNHIDRLLEKKFPGVEVYYDAEDLFDTNPTGNDQKHFDNIANREIEIKRILKFTDENQQKEFHRLVDILKNGATEEKSVLLREIGYTKI